MLSNIEELIECHETEIHVIKRLLENSIKYPFTEKECSIIYKLACYDLLTSTECKSAIMLMAQKLGNLPIPEED